MSIASRLCGIAFFVSAGSFAGDKDIAVSSVVGYRDAGLIAENIKSECAELGSNVAQSTKAALEEKGWNVSLIEDAEKNEGKIVKIEILNAISSGNAYIGHQKLVSVGATVYVNGQVADEFKMQRTSGGGFMGGFKGSCAVLYRCAEALGRDVAKRINKKQ